MNPRKKILKISSICHVKEITRKANVEIPSATPKIANVRRYIKDVKLRDIK